MIPAFEDSGNLPPGIHSASWQEVERRFGRGSHRKRLLAGFRLACRCLARAGCHVVYLDGSFVTAKPVPADFDACWDMTGVGITKLRQEEPVFFDFSNRRAAQKSRFGGEFFPAQGTVDAVGTIFLQFFQQDKETGEPRGIIAIDLRNLS